MAHVEIKEDYYAILGVSSKATTDEIETSFKKSLQRLVEAYGTLNNPGRRLKYDWGRPSQDSAFVSQPLERLQDDMGQKMPFNRQEQACRYRLAAARLQREDFLLRRSELEYERGKLQGEMQDSYVEHNADKESLGSSRLAWVHDNGKKAYQLSIELTTLEDCLDEVDEEIACEEMRLGKYEVAASVESEMEIEGSDREQDDGLGEEIQ